MSSSTLTSAPSCFPDPGSNAVRFAALASDSTFLTALLLFSIMAKMGDSVLDLCCGSGDLTFLLSEKVGSYGKVTGLDFSKEQLSIASSRQYLLSKACYINIE
ncbi:hypothetical protein CRYUN_Cryun04dG0145700 [Craigia yunnanensis]